MEIPRHWRLKAQRYRLEGSSCPSCGQLMFPPRPVCARRHCTDRLAQIVDAVIPVLPAQINPSDIESHIRYEITERAIR